MTRQEFAMIDRLHKLATLAGNDIIAVAVVSLSVPASMAIASPRHEFGPLIVHAALWYIERPREMAAVGQAFRPDALSVAGELLALGRVLERYDL